MNGHSFLDRFTTAIPSLFMWKNGYFARSLETPSFNEWKEMMQTGPLKIPKSGNIQEISMDTPEGHFNPAIMCYQWKGNDFPTIIYHHGNNERPFDFSRGAKNIFPGIFKPEISSKNINILIIRAAFHDKKLKDYMQRIRHLKDFTGMLMASVCVAEMAWKTLKKRGSQPLLLTGISLGAWVTNLHRTYFNSMDSYIPVLGGAALDQLFLSSAYRKMTARKARNKPEYLREKLNFEKDFAQVESDNCYPLLGRYDQYIQYEKQVVSYGNIPVEVIPKGHLTAIMQPAGIKQHLLKHLPV